MEQVLSAEEQRENCSIKGLTMQVIEIPSSTTKENVCGKNSLQSMNHTLLFLCSEMIAKNGVPTKEQFQTGPKLFGLEKMSIVNTIRVKGHSIERCYA